MKNRRLEATDMDAEITMNQTSSTEEVFMGKGN